MMLAVLSLCGSANTSNGLGGTMPSSQTENVLMVLWLRLLPQEKQLSGLVDAQTFLPDNHVFFQSLLVSTVSPYSMILSHAKQMLTFCCLAHVNGPTSSARVRMTDTNAIKLQVDFIHWIKCGCDTHSLLHYHITTSSSPSIIRTHSHALYRWWECKWSCTHRLPVPGALLCGVLRDLKRAALTPSGAANSWSDILITERRPVLPSRHSGGLPTASCSDDSSNNKRQNEIQGICPDTFVVLIQYKWRSCVLLYTNSWCC